MRGFNGFLQAIKMLFFLQTGRCMGDIPADREAVIAIFLPIMGLAAGLLSALAALLLQSISTDAISAVGGLAVLAVLGGLGRIRALSGVFSQESRVAGTAAITTLFYLFEAFALSYRDGRVALIYLPIAADLAILAAAASQREGSAAPGLPFSAVKGGHMLLSALISFMLLLPAFGLKAILFMALAVLSGAFMAAVLRKAGKNEKAAGVAAIVSEVLFLVLFMWLQHQPVIYY